MWLLCCWSSIAEMFVGVPAMLWTARGNVLVPVRSPVVHCAAHLAMVGSWSTFSALWISTSALQVNFIVMPWPAQCLLCPMSGLYAALLACPQGTGMGCKNRR